VPAVLIGPNDDVESLLAGGVRALHGEGDLRASRAWFDAAYERAERDGDAPAMAHAALGLGGLWVHEHRTVATATVVQAWQRHALSLVDPDSALGRRLRARLAAESDYRGGTSTAILARLDEARASGDPVVVAEALSLAHHCVLGPEHTELRRTLADELVALSTTTGRPGDLLMGMLWQAVDLFLAGDPHAERHLAQVRDLVVRNDHLAVGYVVNAIEVMLLVRAGEFEQAEQLAKACVQRGEVAGDGDAVGWYGAHLVVIRWYQGRAAELVPMLSEMVHSPTLSTVDNSYFAALAVAAATSGDQRLAASALARLRGGLAELPRSSSWLIAMAGVVEAAYLLGDADLSARAYRMLKPYARLPMMASLGIACFGSTHHALGVAALTIGDGSRAVEHLRAAVNDNLALGHWPAAALSRVRLARALALRGRTTDGVEAERELSTAAREAETLGMSLPELAQRHAVDLVVCRRVGRQWEFTWRGGSAFVGQSVGMGYLATLLANPDREISATDLAADLAAAPDQPGPVSAARTGSSVQPVLDEEAKRQYRHQLSRLEAEIDEFTAGNDIERAARSRAERDWLLAELSAATGVAGRTRPFADNDERARIAVGKAIRRAVHKIGQVDPGIGHELSQTISTGRRCCYHPGWGTSKA